MKNKNCKIFTHYKEIDHKIEKFYRGNFLQNKNLKFRNKPHKKYFSFHSKPSSTVLTAKNLFLRISMPERIFMSGISINLLKQVDAATTFNFFKKGSVVEFSDRTFSTQHVSLQYQPLRVRHIPRANTLFLALQFLNSGNLVSAAFNIKNAKSNLMKEEKIAKLYPMGCKAILLANLRFAYRRKLCTNATLRSFASPMQYVVSNQNITCKADTLSHASYFTPRFAREYSTAKLRGIAQQSSFLLNPLASLGVQYSEAQTLQTERIVPLQTLVSLGTHSKNALRSSFEQALLSFLAKNEVSGVAQRSKGLLTPWGMHSKPMVFKPKEGRTNLKRVKHKSSEAKNGNWKGKESKAQIMEILTDVSLKKGVKKFSYFRRFANTSYLDWFNINDPDVFFHQSFIFSKNQGSTSSCGYKRNVFSPPTNFAKVFWRYTHTFMQSVAPYSYGVSPIYPLRPVHPVHPSDVMDAMELLPPLHPKDVQDAQDAQDAMEEQVALCAKPASQTPLTAWMYAGAKQSFAIKSNYSTLRTSFATEEKQIKSSIKGNTKSSFVQRKQPKKVALSQKNESESIFREASVPLLFESDLITFITGYFSDNRSNWTNNETSAVSESSKQSLENKKFSIAGSNLFEGTFLRPFLPSEAKDTSFGQQRFANLFSEAKDRFAVQYPLGIKQPLASLGSVQIEPISTKGSFWSYVLRNRGSFFSNFQSYAKLYNSQRSFASQRFAINCINFAPDKKTSSAIKIRFKRICTDITSSYYPFSTSSFVLPLHMRPVHSVSFVPPVHSLHPKDVMDVQDAQDVMERKEENNVFQSRSSLASLGEGALPSFSLSEAKDDCVQKENQIKNAKIGCAAHVTQSPLLLHALHLHLHSVRCNRRRNANAVHTSTSRGKQTCAVRSKQRKNAPITSFASKGCTGCTGANEQNQIFSLNDSLKDQQKLRFLRTRRKRYANVFPGQLVTYGTTLANRTVTTESGQVLYIDSQQITIRKAQTVLIYSQAIIDVLSEEWIKKGTPLMSLSYQKLVTGDIVQGLPKIEQFFEAPVLRDGTFWSDSLQAKLNQFFQEEREKLPLAEAVRKGFSEIQRVLVEGVQRVYISQGVLIADKHLEVIVRQMTCKGRILYSGDTGFLRNELVSLDKIENVNQVTYGQKALYHPQVRGITDASLESESFLSAASFQETTRVLSRDAIIGKTDLMRGLKERVIVGELIQAGTGLANNSVYNLF